LKQSVIVSSDIHRSARVMQAEGIFDIPPSKRTELCWEVNLPLEERDWNIGLIEGASGSGKSTVARALWPEQLASRHDWPTDKSLLDGFPPEMGVKEIIELLSSVGFSSPPSWVRPYAVLSNGEQFRVSMARVLAETQREEIAVVDEFTSVVDRTVAQIGSAAIARTIRKRGQRFVAVTCHEDVLEWLQPDWVYRPGLGEFAWRYLQRRPAIELEVCRVHHSAWRLFRNAHYLDTSLNQSALCFVAFWGDRPVAFTAALGFPHAIRPGWRLHRTVCLPDYQGVGIGNALSELIASALAAHGKPVFRTAAHPSTVGHSARSPKWKMSRGPSRTAGKGQTSRAGWSHASRRLTVGFEYVGPRMEKAAADALLAR
jgi:GNAT superfamily N-acetyltransferase